MFLFNRKDRFFLSLKQKKPFYRDDSDEAIESNSPEFPHPPHEIKIFNSKFFSFNFTIRG